MLIFGPFPPQRAWVEENFKAEALFNVSFDELIQVYIATKTEMPRRDAPSIVSVITGEEIRNSGAKNLEEVLRQIAGFYLFKRAIYPMVNVSVRGLGALSNPGIKMMVNGHSVEDPVEFNAGLVMAFPVDLIKKIEIIRGPGSALYGGSAMNGVINIITKDGTDPSAISASYGSFETYGGTGGISYSADETDLFVFADAVYSDGDPQYIESDAASETFPPGHSHAPGHTNEAFDCRTYFAKLTWQDDFYLTGYYRDENREPPVGLANALVDESGLPDMAAFVEAGYDGSPADWMRLSAKAYYDRKEADVRYEMFNEETTALFGFPEGEGIHMEADAKIYKIGAELSAGFTVSDSLEIVAGAMYEHLEEYGTRFWLNANIIGEPMVLDGETHMPMQYLGGMRDVTDSYNYTNTDELRRCVYAGYVQGTWDVLRTFPGLGRIGENLTVTGGLRLDEYSDVGSAATPRIGIVYAPDRKFFFKALYGEAFRPPGFNEMHLKNNPSGIGNPDLEPEYMKTSEILAGVNFTENVTATLDLFSVRKENAIRHFRTTYRNWGKVKSQGAEGEIRVSFGKNNYGYFNFTFQEVTDVSHETTEDTGGAEYRQEDFDYGAYPEAMANLGINLGITRHVNANMSVNHIASVERIGNMQFTPDPADPDGTVEKADGRDPMEGYTLVNLSLILGDFDFAKGLEFQLTGYNIFDADHRDPEQSASVAGDLPRFGRHFLGKITYAF